jgi:arylsulfatase A-like enzyme
MSKFGCTRRDFLKTVSLGAACAVVPGCISTAKLPKGKTSANEQGRRPDILWISCEDISPDLGCYGDDYADTPNLDRLAKQGCRYSNAFVPYPVCAPTRSAVITGMYPSTIGTMHMRTSLKGYEAVPPSYVKCFTEYLRAAGYYCTNNVKTDYQFNPPFTAWDECSRKAHWRNRPKGMPFFSVINLTVSHESQSWPKKGEKLVHDPAKVVLPPYYPDTPAVRENLARYYDNVTRMDKQAGKILRQLEKDGLADNTVVFFWSDHGRGLPRHKRWVYDSGIHVPMIIRWPGKVKPGSVCNDFINLIDLGPTVLSIAGVEIPAYMQGRAFLGGQKGKLRKYIFAGRERMDETADDHIRCVRDKRYKYIRNFMPEKAYAQSISYRDRMPIMKEWRRLNAEGKLKGPQKLFFRKTKPVEELYDVGIDPHEVNNLAESPEYKDVLKRMRAVLEEWIKETGDLGGIPEEELIERMWPGRKQPVTEAPVIKTTSTGGKMTVKITCATEGASIGYRLGDKGHWLLYTEPIRLDVGTELQTKAIRIGYKPSEEVHKIVGL